MPLNCCYYSGGLRSAGLDYAFMLDGWTATRRKNRVKTKEKRRKVPRCWIFGCVPEMRKSSAS